MPAKFDRCVKKVAKKSRGKVNAFAVCTAAGTRGRKSNPPQPGTPQHALLEKLKQAGIPYKEIEVYGSQIVVTVLSRDTANKWATLLVKFSKVRGITESMDYNKENKNTVMLPSAHKVWRVFATVTKQNGRRSRNPESGAADFYQSFHGTESTEEVVIEEKLHYHSNLGGIGILVEVHLLTVTGIDMVLTFSDPDALASANPGNSLWAKVKGLGKKISKVGSKSTHTRLSAHDETISKGVTYKGKTIYKFSEGGYKVAQLDPRLSFTSAKDAKEYVDAVSPINYTKAQKAALGKNPKTKLDLILDGVKAKKKEVSIDTEGYTKDQVDRIIATARGRGLDASYDGRWVLVRDMRKSNPGAGSLDLTLLTSNEKGTQLYFSGGDQSVPLDAMKMDDPEFTDKDSIILGEAYFVSYFTRKDFDDFQPTVYEHDLAEESDPPSPKYRKGENHTSKNRRLVGTGTGFYPFVRYDVRNEKLYLDGGSYHITLPTFETSPGIED